jgi:hypothetical protein
MVKLEKNSSENPCKKNELYCMLFTGEHYLGKYWFPSFPVHRSSPISCCSVAFRVHFCKLAL